MAIVVVDTNGDKPTAGKLETILASGNACRVLHSDISNDWDLGIDLETCEACGFDCSFPQHDSFYCTPFAKDSRKRLSYPE